MRETRQKIKRLAKSAMGTGFFKLLLLLGLQYITTALLVRVFGLLGNRFSPETTVEFAGLSVNYVSVLASVLTMFLSAPLELGIAEYILGIVRKKEVHLGEVFNWYGDGKLLLKSIPLGFWNAVVAVFQVALFDIPLSFVQTQLDAVLLDIQKQYESGAEFIFANYGLMDWRGIAIAVAAMIFAGILASLFVCVKFIYLDSGRFFFSVFSSPRLMLRHLVSYVLFVLSFAGFYVGTVFTFGLLGLYLLPYFGVSQVVFVEYVRAKAKFDGNAEAWV